MRSKRFFAILLAVCMVLGNLAPAASAVAAPADSFVMPEQKAEESAVKSDAKASPFENELVVSGEKAEEGLLNLRDNPLVKPEVNNNAEGSWVATPTDKPEAELTHANSISVQDELNEAANYFAADELVAAFVVMADKPLAESAGRLDQVDVNVEKSMLQKQNAVIAAIEKDVLHGEKLEVRYQFTYLTNAFTVRTTLANLKQIAEMEGVKTVFVTPVYSPVTTATPNTASSGAMTGVHTVWEDLGYTGQGMKIAIIDTGLDLDHPSFAAAPEGASMTADDIAAVLQDLNAYDRMSGLTAEDLYRSEKVPYAFNYVDSNLNADHSRDQQGDHGTHVAGIAAANALESTSVVGMAPDAQIIVMKVFGQNGGAYTDDFVAAIEDAMTLGCDAINLSLGSPSGFSSTDTEIDLIFERIASQDVIVTLSAGNEGTSSYANMWGTNQNRTQNPDNGAVGAPSTYANGFSIASAENAAVMTPYITVGEHNIFFQDSIEAMYGYTYDFRMTHGGETYEYVVIDGLGNPDDFYDAEGLSLVEGKVAVVKRGELSFYDKVSNAAYAGAVACIIWNNNPDDDIFTFGMNTMTENDEYPFIRSILISLDDGQKMADAEEKVLYVAEDMGERLCEGGQMSSFSSWGVSPDLRLVPDITGIGGNVYSCYDGGQYGLMSGTSMSAPQIAGVSALVLQYLHNEYPNATDGELRELALALMMSTADPIIDANSGVEASPRQQGAGLIDAAEAVSSGAYLTVGGNRPKVELGDDRWAEGSFTFSFEIHNTTDAALSYTLDASLLTEDVVDYGLGSYFMAGYDRALTGSVEFDKTTVTVPANGKADVTATITLSEEDLAYFDAAWPNGGFVEGYVYLTNEEGEVSLNLPFLGFYGDWTDAPMFDTAYWYDNSFWGLQSWPEGDEYYHILWTNLGAEDYVLGMSPYGVYLDENGNIPYDPKYNSVSPNGDGYMDGITEIYLSLLRPAKNLTFTWAADGEIMDQYTCVNVTKTMYISGYGRVVPFVHSWYSDPYNFTDANGNVLPEGTVVTLTVEGELDYGNGGDNTLEFSMVVDTTAPELVDVVEMPQEDGSQYLGVMCTENVGTAGAFILNNSGTRVLAEGLVQDNGDGTALVLFDITGIGNEFQLVLGDYAANESYYTIKYESSENLPEMDTDLLYAYRVNDSIYNQYYGYDYQFGWVSMNKPENAEDAYLWVNQETSDHLEHYAISAAEYAGGKIFAIDAGYNFVVMNPGLWDRQTICNIGVGALDMAFDDTTDTMYVLTKSGSRSYLNTIDLLTGELTQLKSLGYYNSAPYAITVADDGTIYAVKYASSSYNKNYLYTLDKANDYAMTPVVNAAGENVALVDSYGNNCAPNYAQSMTYSNGMLYWAYFTSTWQGNAAQMITIDTNNDFALTAMELATYYPELEGASVSDTEMVGLLTLDETDYVLPEAGELKDIWLESTRLVIAVGEKADLAVNPIPWNFELTDLSWSSSDESVVTVADGKLTGVSEGDAVITVVSGNFSATCQVTVVNTDGGFYAYDFVNNTGNDGDLIYVDLAAMDYTSLGLAPVDFLAAEYNGHEGNYYGYTEGGQFWRWNLSTGEYVALGSPIGLTPTDMAYDYTTGFMYATTVDYMTGKSSLCAVNMTNGQLVPLADGALLMTLACDAEGNLFSINASGELLKLTIGEWGLETEVIMSELGNLQYMQSMCYSFENDVLYWANPESSQVYWIGHNNANPYVLTLGDPTGSGLFEFVGMFEIPAEIPELPEVAVESLTASDMMLIKGSTKLPDYTIAPLNATCQDIVWTSSDESIVKVNADGSLTGVADGTAVITGVLVDTVSGNTLETTFNVTVMTVADNIYGHILTDFASYGGQFWAQLDAADTANPIPLAGTDYIIYSEEYYNGKLYAYGYDAYDWEANWQMFVINPTTFEIEEQFDMGEGCPFVYDITYDYNSSTMYALAGASSSASDLYIVNLSNGALIPFMATEQFFMSLAAGPDGKLYAMEQSQMDMNWETWMVEYAPANLYVIDPAEQTIELVGSTGVKSNMMASMAYDYDTDMLYWTALLQDEMTGTMSGGLHFIDPETAVATNLGTIGLAGAQVSGLFILCDAYPEETEELKNLVMTPSSAMIAVGDQITLSAMTMPMDLAAEITWTSSDETVATVADGVVTGLAQGSATITVTATFNGVTKSCESTIVVLEPDAGFLTYNATDGGWALINRHDQSVVTNLNEGENETEVNAVVSVGADVYGVDVENNLFKLNTETFAREQIATLAVELDVESGYDSFEVVDLEYDAANNRMLALGNMYNSVEGEMYYGRAIYELDLTTGELTELYNFGYDIYIMTMAVDPDGMVYFYTAYDDYINKLDLTTGEYVPVVTLQTQSIYGDYESDQAMYYDELTDTVYMLVTTNGNFYRLLSIDATLGTLTVVGDVGEIEEIDWAYHGDYFAGLTFVSAEAEGDDELPEVPADHYFVEWVSTTASLGGDIGLNFYAKISTNIVNDPDAYVLFTFNGSTIKVPMSDAVVSVVDGVTRYRFTCQVSAKQMSQNVTAQVMIGDEAIGKSLTNSVKSYGEYLLENYSNEKLLDLVKAMLNYGASAQMYFKYNTADLANSSLSEADKALADVDASAYASSVVGAEEGIEVAGASLLLDSETTVRVYFKLTGDKTIDQYTFTVDGQEVTPVANGGKYYVEVRGIGAHRLDEFHTFTVGGMTVNYCALSYVNVVLDKATDQTLIDCVKALYAYAMAAEAYIA